MALQTTTSQKELIEEITFQSDLLALSAALKAAGSRPDLTTPASVADELRHLAQTVKSTVRRSAKARPFSG